MQKPTESSPTTLNLLAERIYQALANQFPICCSSDEFYYFPQVVVDGHSRWGWDDLSLPAVNTFVDRSQQWETEIKPFLRFGDVAARIDAELLLHILLTLREQLQRAAPQQRQPTFHLSIVVAGLSEALESGDPEALVQRIASLPEFLLSAGNSLNHVPLIFMQLGKQMLEDLRSWFAQLESAGYGLGDAQVALKQFADRLQSCSTCEDFALPGNLFEDVLSRHIGCAGDFASIEAELHTEYAEMEDILHAEAAELIPGKSWQQAEPHIPFVLAPEDDLGKLYSPELLRQENHARKADLVPQLAGNLQPQLAEVPESMKAIRASDAYSAKVGYPAQGGTFYLLSRERNSAGRTGRTLEYRMTAAHEAWPGHHLLDVCRWNLSRPLRRPLEQPLFYEGWACFAEQLMAETGYFDGPWDRFLLARRRIERAARGLIDIGLQTGQLDLTAASQQLVSVGYLPQKAAAVVPKYALRPGYQVCYTLGLRNMLQLRADCKKLTDGEFSRQLLSQGEIGFTALKKALRTEGD